MHPEDRATPDTAKAPPLRVLIADDNEDAADMLAMILDSKGHEVRVAHDGLEAISSAQAFNPDVMLLDIGMPELDGHQVAEQIRKVSGESVMLVAITGWSEAGSTPESRAEAFTRFDHHLVKPIDLEQLTACLAARQAKKREQQ